MGPFSAEADLKRRIRDQKRCALLPLRREEVDALIRWWLGGASGPPPAPPAAPEGAGLVAFGWAEHGQCFAAKYHHPDWPPTGEGQAYPFLDRA